MPVIVRAAIVVAAGADRPIVKLDDEGGAIGMVRIPRAGVEDPLTATSTPRSVRDHRQVVLADPARKIERGEPVSWPMTRGPRRLWEHRRQTRQEIDADRLEGLGNFQQASQSMGTFGEVFTFAGHGPIEFPNTRRVKNAQVETDFLIAK